MTVKAAELSLDRPRLHPGPERQDPSPPLRRTPQLEPLRHRHSPRKSEEPTSAPSPPTTTTLGRRPDPVDPFDGRHRTGGSSAHALMHRTACRGGSHDVGGNCARSRQHRQAGPLPRVAQPSFGSTGASSTRTERWRAGRAQIRSAGPRLERGRDVVALYRSLQGGTRTGRSTGRRWSPTGASRGACARRRRDVAVRLTAGPRPGRRPRQRSARTRSSTSGRESGSGGRYR